MGIDRYLREQAYHTRRKRNLKKQKKGPQTQFVVMNMSRGSGNAQNKLDFTSIKKLIGVGLVVIALLLLLSQCFFKGDKQTQANGDVHSSIGYYTAMQDFPVDPEFSEKLMRYAMRYQQTFSDSFALWSIANTHQMSHRQVVGLIKSKDRILSMANIEDVDGLSRLYEQFIYDVVCFPVDQEYNYSYQESWKESRTYKSERKHYGTDIMANDVGAGTIPIISMTEGIVENIGWNELGGYRVGIRSNGGAYFYYAHLAELPTHIKKGDRIKAGDRIGLMGDTGYGPEGTKGQFPVHLHIGIALVNEEEKEYWINPYPILKYLEIGK
ncbi:MAG: M23 family metallopeptidase [Cellulosilyticaceae bacterium]